MNSIAPLQADIRLGEIMRQLDIADELFWVPERLVQFEHWVGHIPFAFWLVKTLRPRRIVELGTHRGNSYCAFCQTIATLQLDAQAFAVDTWEGDIHMEPEAGVLEDLRAYHDPRFGGFSTLLQMTFDEARERIENRSIDLLHIDGTHTYEAVKHDFDCWKSVLSSRSVVLFHDTCVRRDNYEVWRLWNELSPKHPSFEFRHSFGLGVLGIGEDLPLTLRNLFAMSEDDRVASTVRALFASCGDAHVRTLAVSRLEQDLNTERYNAARREAALQYWQDWVKQEHDRLEQDLKAERDNAVRREAALQASVKAERDAADRNARTLEESTAQNRRLHALRTSAVWRATWPIRRVTGASTKLDVIPPDLAKLVSACFDEVWYDQKYGLEARKLRGLNHYFRIGMKAGYSPNAAFDEAFYLSTNPDVGEAVQADAFLCGFEHYIRHGRFEGRSGQSRPEEPTLSVTEVSPDLAKLVSACFDEVWYDQRYGLEARKLRGLDHYFRIGMKAGYSPNAAFDEAFYLSTNPDVGEAVQAGAFLCGYEHYIRHGRFEGRSGQGRPHDYSHLRPMFDEDWYDKTYELKHGELHGFSHYLAKGARRGYSPYADFDEEFYSAFYSDVRMTISSRGYLCGYEHYVLVGRAENRLTKPILTKMLDQRYPGLTNPVGISLAREIERRLAPIAASSGADEESYWILVPTFDPSIFFGGYKALIEFIVGLGSLKRRITVIICESDDDGSYFRYWITRQPGIAKAFRTVRIVNARRLTASLLLSPTDKIFAYSAWEAHLAHHMASNVKSGLFAWLVQEYEAVFHDYSAEHAIVASAYDLPHYPIFNSTELKDYFRHHRLGIFSGDRLPSPRRDFAVFDHVLTKLSAPTLADLKSRSSRTLIFYARPEPHAKRNLFPLALIALKEMSQQGSFVGPWEFHGLGALTETTIPLGRGHSLNLHPKMTEAEYVAFMQKVDIGLSLMYAPHPGLIAFEMASVGARVVTNSFDNRSETYLRGLSENIVPCEPTISGIKQALTEAIVSLDDFSGRVRGMRINRSQGVNSWSEVFNDNFFHCEMDGFLGTD